MRAHAIVVAALCAAACTDQRPSSGECRGTLGGSTVDGWIIAPEVSDFHRSDGILGDEDGPFRAAYRSTALTIDAELESMPQESYLGAHDISSDPILHFFRVESPVAGGSFDGGTMTLTTATRDRMAGTFLLRWSDSSELTCIFDLRRNYTLDTDD